MARTRQRAAASLDVDHLEFRYGWIGPREAMRHLGVHSLSALYRLINEHRLPFGRQGGRYRFRRHDLDEWMVVRGVERVRSIA